MRLANFLARLKREDPEAADRLAVRLTPNRGPTVEEAEAALHEALQELKFNIRETLLAPLRALLRGDGWFRGGSGGV